MKLLFLLCTAIFMVQLDTTMLIVAFPAIQQSFPNVTQVHLAWILNIYTIIYGSFMIPTAAYADQIGRKKFFAAGIFIFTAASLLCGLSQDVTMLIVWRALQAIGAALLVPSSLALLLALVPQQKKSVAISIWAATAAAATALGPSFGAVIIQNFGWRESFFINIPVGIVALIAVMKFIPESRQPRQHLPSIVTSILLAATIISFLTAIKEGTGFESQRMIYLSAAMFALIGFLWTNSRAASPTIDFSLFKNRTLSVGCFATFLFSSAWSAMFLGMILYATRIWKYSTVEAGLSVTAGPIMTLFASILAGKYAAKHGHRAPIVAGGIIFALGALERVLWPQDNVNFILGWLPCVVFIGIGVGFVSSSLQAASTFFLPKDRLSMGSGIATTIKQVAQVCGVILATLLINGTEGFQNLFLLITFAGFATAMCGFAINTKPAAAAASAPTQQTPPSDGKRSA